MNSKLINRIYIFSISIFFFSLCSKVFLCSALAVKGVKLQNYVERRVSLEKEIASLSFEQSSLSNIRNLEERAHNLGFLPMEETLRVIDTISATKVASLNIR